MVKLKITKGKIKNNQDKIIIYFIKYKIYNRKITEYLFFAP